MSYVPLEIWYKIASYIECPNPVLYTRLAAVSSTARAVFSSDQVWGRISPGSFSSGHFERFSRSVEQQPPQIKHILAQCWAAVDEMSNPSTACRLERTLKARADALYIREILSKYAAVPEIFLPIAVWYAINPEADASALAAAAPLLLVREFVEVAVRVDGRCLRLAPEFWDDKEIVMIAVSSRGEVLEHVSDRLCLDNAIVLAAVSSNGSAIRFMNSALASDRNIALKAVQSHGWALQQVAQRFLEDREIVLSAILNYCAVLQFASITLRADRALVTAAVSQQGWTLRYAAPELQDDLEVVEAATKCDPSAIRYASENLRDNKCLMLSVLGRDNSLFSLASPRLQADPDIRRALGASAAPLDTFSAWIMKDWSVSTRD